MTDPYVYPGTEILKNKFNCRNKEEFNILERNATAKRLKDIREMEAIGNFNFEHLKKIHKYIFQDVYSWAGEIRNVDISKGNSLFCKSEHIESYASDIFRNLKRENYFKDIDNKEILSKKLAETFLDINALHPFREGNGRTQREFIRSLAKFNGYELSFSNISKEEMIKLSSLSNDYSDELAKKFYNGMEKINDVKKEVETFLKKNKISKDNYNVFTGNRIIVENHLSGDKRWIRLEDVEKNNIKVNENEKPLTAILTGKNEKGNLKVTTVKFYNVSQLQITKEIEEKFVPMKQKEQEKVAEKSKDKGMEIED